MPASRSRLPATLMAAMLLAPAVALLLVRALVADLQGPAASPPSAAAMAPKTPDKDPMPQIHGRILDADGNPVKGAAVRLVSAKLPYSIYADAESDAVGKFSFTDAGSELVRVVADHEPEGAVTSAELQPAQRRSTEVTLVLSPASAVRGTVVDTEDHPVAGATLYVEGVPWIARGATSDADGAFRLAMVPDGVTSLVAVARGYKSARVALPPREDSVELVVLVKLVAASAVNGDVSDPDGHPIRARVVACEGQPAESSVVSAEDGTFELPPSAIGCEAVATHDEYEASDPVVLVEGRGVRLRLRPGGAIEGVVVEESGAGVASFTVGVEASYGTQSGRIRATPPRKVEDPRGSFRLEKLTPGRYVLTAGNPGRPPGRSNTIDVAGGVTTTNVRIVLPKGGSVVGHVFGERHTPLEGVDLRFDAVSSVIDGSAHAQTDTTGQYRLDGAPSGFFTLLAQKGGFRTRMLSGLRVDSHGSLAKDITLSAVDGGAGLEFGGIGANLSQTPEGLAFGAVFAGDPAERAGLRAGDRILGIDADSTDGMSVADALQRLRGEAGTRVGVSVQRPTGETVDVLIERLTITR